MPRRHTTLVGTRAIEGCGCAGNGNVPCINVVHSTRSRLEVCHTSFCGCLANGGSGDRRRVGMKRTVGGVLRGCFSGTAEALGATSVDRRSLRRLGANFRMFGRVAEKRGDASGAGTGHITRFVRDRYSIACG